MINRQKQNGSSLIETIVALIVMGAGLMGVLSMQVKSVSFLKDASLYSQAAFLAEDIYESMLSTPSAKGKYNFNFGDAIPAKPDCVQLASNCTPEQMAEWHIHNWRNNVASLLPGGRGEVIRTAGDQIVIRVEFQVGSSESGASGERETKVYQMTTDL